MKGRKLNYRRNILLIFSLVSILFFITGCKNKMKWLDEKLGQGFNKIENASLNEIINYLNLEEKFKEEKDMATTSPADLTKDIKEKIDKWLQDNNFNRYGDSKETMYTGGTPLFNEETGKSIERFEYILKKHPDILTRINENQ